ncbi:MAG TPA: hypothetical protein VMV17_16695 [Streptosporangiaceae bacterium]|nr:hypothetical protein [Streptosporangiaceae bacterium]
MYQPFPTGDQPPLEPGRPQAPRPVRTAVTLMYVGAGLSAISLIVTVLSFHTIENVIRNASTTTRLTQSQIHGLAVAAVVIASVESLIAVGLWMLMAWANKNGQNWGRIVASVLFGINTLILLLSFARATASVSLVFELVVWLVGLGAIILLWRKESSVFFAAASTRR